MFRWFDNLLLSLKNRAGSFATELRENESGIDGFVAAVILVVIVVLLAALFYGLLTGWFDGLWDTITNTTEELTTAAH